MRQHTLVMAVNRRRAKREQTLVIHRKRLEDPGQREFSGDTAPGTPSICREVALDPLKTMVIRVPTQRTGLRWRWIALAVAVSGFAVGIALAVRFDSDRAQPVIAPAASALFPSTPATPPTPATVAKPIAKPVAKPIVEPIVVPEPELAHEPNAIAMAPSAPVIDEQPKPVRTILRARPRVKPQRPPTPVETKRWNPDTLFLPK